MKKLLLVSTAIAGVALLSSPASAALKMDLGGYFEGYGVYADNNIPAADALNTKDDFTFQRTSMIFVNGESTLDNGLTIGAHTQLNIADENTAAAAPATGVLGMLGQTTNQNPVGTTMVDEDYLYASGGWGRFNFGQEDGAAYLLQVAAPSADSNVDGMRVYVQQLNTALWDLNLANLVLSYQQADFRQSNRLTYLTPKFNGFQAGVSYDPLPAATFVGSSVANPSTYTVPTAAGYYKNAWEGAARWDGEFQGVALSLGGGYSDASAQDEGTVVALGSLGSRDLETYNFGGNVAWGGFSLGGAYKHSNEGVDPKAGASADVKTWDVGGGYDNGPYHAGLSYLHDSIGDGLLADGVGALAGDSSVHRYAAGGGYTFGPGMTFRGSVDWGKFDASADTTDVSERFTQVTVGTDVQF